METATAAGVRRRQINAHGLSWPAADTLAVRRLRRPLLMGLNAPRATLLRRLSEGPASGTMAPSRRIGEAETARGKPVSHEHRADDADQRASDHVAGMMGQQHQATDRRSEPHTQSSMARACGQTAETAKASAKLVMAWPDGKLA